MIPDILIISIHMWNRLDKEEKIGLKRQSINRYHQRNFGKRQKKMH